MARLPLPLPQRLPPQQGFGDTRRKDAWWLQPLLVFLGLMAFVVYSTWAAFQGEHYAAGPYLSPMYSPLLFEAPGHPATGHAWFGDWPSWLMWLPAILMTPAILILWAPGGFRFTCYYYRGAYYKAFWQDPTSCAVGEPRKGYLGERWLPLVLQNVHRYFLYLAIVFIGVLAYDAWIAMWWPVAGAPYGHDVPLEFGFGVGTLVLIINPILLGGYTFGCHSLRHLIGGRRDRLTGGAIGKKPFDCVSCLNRRHMLFAWLSLFWVGFTDFYVRMVSMGYWTDLRIF